MIEALGWTSTILVLFGYILNAKMKHQAAMVAWIVGDVGWITYDFFITNISHLVLSLVIISINLYGIYQYKVMQNGGVKQP
tara:strand:- start:727 stop:969 length:243 start_codon:yes stop_codon:yes gene_type:complete